MPEIEWKRTRVYKETWEALHSDTKLIINWGGSRSSKTYSAIQCLVKYAYLHPNTRISVVSRSLPHLKKGAYRDFDNLYNQGVRHLGRLMLTNFTFTLHNGSYIEFFGLENPDKAHGPGRDILFMNEANFIPISVYRQLAQRTTEKIMVDFNPSQFNSWVYDLLDEQGVTNIHSTYRDNPFLSKNQVEFIESYQYLPDDYMWKVYGLGERGYSSDLIFPKFNKVDKMPNKGEVFYGLDFGYINPTALVRCEIYEGQLYVEEVIYESKLSKPDLVNRLKGLRGLVYADSAEPDSIDEIAKAGVNIFPASKDVWAGIVSLKSIPINIVSSPNLLSEIQSYRWKKNRDDLIQEEPIKEKDHLIDAMRYGYYSYICSKANLVSNSNIVHTFVPYTKGYVK